MLALMKKNGYFFGLYLLGLIPLMTLWWLTASGDLNLFKIMFQGGWLAIMVVGCVGVSEQNETKNNGYAFLKTLPLSIREIVTAKFSVMFLAVLLLGIHSTLLYQFRTGPDFLVSLGKAYALLSSCAGLILGALMYLALYRFGQGGFAKIAWIAVILILLSPVLVIEAILPKLRLDVQEISAALSGFSAVGWIIVILGTLTIYYALMGISIKVKSKQAA